MYARLLAAISVVVAGCVFPTTASSDNAVPPHACSDGSDTNASVPAQSPRSPSRLRSEPIQPLERGAQSPAAELASFQLADPDLHIELVAAEPDIMSPVAIAWDARGRLYVAEMFGYPTTEAACRIALLEDRDGDGRYQRAATFAEGLSFVTSVMPYRGGILATAAPDLLFLKDTDGDNRAELRQVVWTGFGTGSQQLRANSLHWGIDNWIYGANGRCDGDIKKGTGPFFDPECASQQKRLMSPFSIRGRDFRFHPRRGAFEAIAGQSQFGQAHDDWGNRFLSWNTIPVRHVVMEDRYLVHCPQRMPDIIVDVADPSDTGRVFPTSPPPRQFNTEQANYYNAMCGLAIYRGDRLGASYAGNAFVGESLSNLVTRRVLQPVGPTFVSRRADEERDREFLASTDSWFHPVQLTTGPDGSLYVVDFYREFVEHPIYVADPVARAQTDWRHGAEHGRIWRIDRRGSPPAIAPSRWPDEADLVERVRQLEHPIGWWRDTAQRLLVERQAVEAVGPLRDLVRTSASPLARLHALWTLHGLDALDESTLLVALADADAGIRRHAIRMAEDRLRDSSALREALLARVDDPDARVRFQLALSLSAIEGSAADTALVRLAGELDDLWLSLAVMCSSARAPWRVMQPLALRPAWSTSPSPRQAEFLQQLAEQLGARRDRSEIEACVAWLSQADGRSVQLARLAGLAGLLRGLSNDSIPPRIRLAPPGNTDSDRSLGWLRPIIRTATHVAEERDLDVVFRRQAIEVLAWYAGLQADTAGLRDEARSAERRTELGQTTRLLLDLLLPAQPAPVQTAAARALATLDHPASSRAVYQRWHQLGTPARHAVLASALRSPAATEALFASLERQQVLPVEVPGEVRVALAASRDDATKQRAATLLQPPSAPDRQTIVDRYRPALSLRGDQRRGARLFQEHCLNCHAVQGYGQRVGPDLASAGSRHNDLLLVDILDPSRIVTPDYVSYIVVTQKGQVLAGLIVAETADSVTLRRAGGEQDTITRGAIAELRASGKSIMPDGLEEKLDVRQLADVLEFLRRPDATLLKRNSGS